MGREGYIVPEETLRSIIQMLSSTDLPVKEIADRTSCNQHIVVSINRRFQVRLFTLARRQEPKQEGHFTQRM